MSRVAVASTGLLVAAIRAHEAQREDGLVRDPFAAMLAGKTGLELLR
jgi:O-methyltransferase involved in polyketide biosynthesis